MDKKGLKYYQSLLLKKNRKSEGKFLAEGKRLVLEGLESKAECEIVFITKDFFNNNQDIYNKLIKHKHKVEILKQEHFNKLSDTEATQGMIGVFKCLTANYFNDSKQKIIVALENISDPGNLGTIIRNCDWFGINEIILGENCVELYNPKVIRSTMGSVFHIKFVESENLIDSLNQFKAEGYKVVCADMDGENIFKFKQPEKSIVVFSNEASGPSDDLISITDFKITIPKLGKAESLNVANAAAVTLAELTKGI